MNKAFTIHSILKDIFQEKTEATEALTASLSEDLLVLSCCLYRLRKEKSFNGSLTDLTLPNKVTELDYALASEIKNYYVRKLLFLSIKDDLKTNYRKDLLNFVNNEHIDSSGKYIYPDNYLGLAYKLPYFYEYDKQLEELFADNKGTCVTGDRSIDDTLTLSFIKTMKKYTKYNNNIEFWFTDSNNNKVMIPVDKHNPMLGLFEHLCTKEKIHITGKFTTKRVDKFEYFIPNRWHFDVSKI